MPAFSPNELSDLTVFLTILRCRSFRKAADQIDVTTSALSHRIRRLEERLGARLLNRTTARWRTTAAGTALAEKIAAGLDLINAGLDDLRNLNNGAAGSVRINVMRDAATLLIYPILPIFAERFPHIELEITVDDHFVDVTAEGFDAGIRYSGTIPEDMITAPLSPELKWVAAASPNYLARKGTPADAGRPPRAPVRSHPHRSRPALQVGIRARRGPPANRRSRPIHFGRHRAFNSRRARRAWALLHPRKACASLCRRGPAGDRARRLGLARPRLRDVLFQPPSGAAWRASPDRSDPRNSASRLTDAETVDFSSMDQ